LARTLRPSARLLKSGSSYSLRVDRGTTSPWEYLQEFSSNRHLPAKKKGHGSMLGCVGCEKTTLTLMTSQTSDDDSQENIIASW
jgi:hypothetical protein